MHRAAGQSGNKLPATPWGELPPRMRVLFITGHDRTGGWLAEAIAVDSAAEVVLEEAHGMAAGLVRLRDEIYDAVLVSHEPAELDALDLLDAVRTGSRGEQPILVLGEAPEAEMDALCYEAGADAYVCVRLTTTRTLLWRIARAMEHHRLLAENRRLRGEQRHRLELEHDEAVRLLRQQHDLVRSLQQIARDAVPPLESNRAGAQAAPAEMPNGPHPPLPSRPPGELPQDASACLSVPLVGRYRELLKAYVVMGSGTLAEEIRRMTRLLVAADATAQQAMMVHLRVLEEMVRGLGSRSARHVMSRADLLILELMINLAESYREQSPAAVSNDELPIIAPAATLAMEMKR